MIPFNVSTFCNEVSIAICFFIINLKVICVFLVFMFIIIIMVGIIGEDNWFGKLGFGKLGFGKWGNMLEGVIIRYFLYICFGYLDKLNY